eukprot:1300055-Pyramimonas_sp.AAC.1
MRAFQKKTFSGVGGKGGIYAAVASQCLSTAAGPRSFSMVLHADALTKSANVWIRSPRVH